MAILFFDETDEEEERRERDRREYTRFFVAKSNNLTDGGVHLQLKRPDLRLFSPHPRDNQALVIRFNPKRRKGGLGMFDVQVEYSNDAAGLEDPLPKRPEIELSMVERTRVRFIDDDGNPCINTVGDLIDDPAPEVDEGDIVFSVKVNIPVRLEAWILQYANAQNNDTVRLRGLFCDPGTLKFKLRNVGLPQVTNGIGFCECNFELHYKADGWTELIPNRGWRQLVKRKIIKLPNKKTATVDADELPEEKGKIVFEPEQILVTTKNGTPDKPTTAPFLDADGRYIESPTFDNIHLLKFRFGPLKPFNDLPLK